ncbi:hypothetical protein NQ318_014154 [Aromia moschata]|uniref:Uncharacterized protein n=1 Tax=Aromia moschata TaxID=1265417 RepID=A0AAV8XAY7_9CUCU|nr:hypothetical protein NQ318_014154 [Aromia moschata]
MVFLIEIFTDIGAKKTQDGTQIKKKYYQLLREQLQIFLDELPIAELNRIYFQQDGTPPHNARINTNWLNTTFNDSRYENRNIFFSTAKANAALRRAVVVASPPGALSITLNIHISELQISELFLTIFPNLYFHITELVTDWLTTKKRET